MLARYKVVVQELVTGEPLESGDRWMTIAEVARALRVTVPQVRNLEGLLRPERMPAAGNRRLYRASLVDAEIARRTLRADASAERRADIARREAVIAERAIEWEAHRAQAEVRRVERQARKQRKAVEAQRKLETLHEAYAVELARTCDGSGLVADGGREGNLRTCGRCGGPGCRLTWETWWRENVAPTLSIDRRDEVPEGPGAKLKVES